MQRVGLLCNFQCGLAAQRGELHIPVHDDWVFFIQVQIELFDLPHAILLRQLGQEILPRRALHAGLCHIGAESVRAVAVLAVHIVGDDNLRLIAPQQLRDKRLRIRLLPAGIGVLQLA